MLDIYEVKMNMKRLFFLGILVAALAVMVSAQTQPTCSNTPCLIGSNPGDWQLDDSKCYNESGLYCGACVDTIPDHNNFELRCSDPNNCSNIKCNLTSGKVISIRSSVVYNSVTVTQLEKDCSEFSGGNCDSCEIKDRENDILPGNIVYGRCVKAIGETIPEFSNTGIIAVIVIGIIAAVLIIKRK